MKKRVDTRTWTAAEVAKQEQDLETRVSEYAAELAAARGRLRLAVSELRKFHKHKITHAHQIVG